MLGHSPSSTLERGPAVIGYIGGGIADCRIQEVVAPSPDLDLGPPVESPLVYSIDIMYKSEMFCGKWRTSLLPPEYFTVFLCAF